MIIRVFDLGWLILVDKWVWGVYGVNILMGLK